MERSMRKPSCGPNKWWTGFWEIEGEVSSFVNSLPSFLFAVCFSCTRFNFDLALISARDVSLTLIVGISAFD